MTRPLAVLRPEPGNAATATRIAARGYRAIRLPLFRVEPVAWDAPAAASFDALILTSANAVRHAGAQLASYSPLPVHAVGETTAAAARDAGFVVASVGGGDARTLLAGARAAGVRRALLLGGRDRAGGGDDPIQAAVRVVYASEAIENIDVKVLIGSVALVHSPRAAARLAALMPPGRRPDIAVAAISAAAADRLGPGWRAVAVADRPDDRATIEAAARLAD